MEEPGQQIESLCSAIHAAGTPSGAGARSSSARSARDRHSGRQAARSSAEQRGDAHDTHAQSYGSPSSRLRIWSRTSSAITNRANAVSAPASRAAPCWEGRRSDPPPPGARPWMCGDR
jgi:hypothetical protein